MPHLTHVVPGEPFRPAAGDWNAFVDNARDSRDRRVISQPGEPSYANEPQLFIALEHFTTTSGGTCRGTRDAYVGRAARLNLDPNLIQNGTFQVIGYQRLAGAVECVWQPAEIGCSSVTTEIKCGEYFWGIWNGQAGRYEALSNGRHDLDVVNDGSACPCKWFGYATWKVVVTGGVAAWVLDENHCSGCYDDTVGRELIVADLRFDATSKNSDWIETPLADPEFYKPSDNYDSNFRYVTCCNVTDSPPPPPCELTCCYVVPLPLPSCSSPSHISQAIMHPNTGGAVCTWAAGSVQVWNEGVGNCCDPTDHVGYAISMSLAVSMTTTQITYNGTIAWGPTGARDTTCPSSGSGYLYVVYNLNATPDCTNDPTATKVQFQANIVNVNDQACQWCGRDLAYLSSLFPSTITATRIACNETTTTNTSTSSTTGTTSTTSTSSTTASSTTSSSTTASSTTASTTTSSSTTASSTTNTSTTTASSTTQPCSSSSCLWTWNGSVWVFTTGCANGGCACDSPGFGGMMVGQTTTTTCRNP